MVIILIGGVPGTGKTTVALKLGSKLGVEQVIHTDTFKELIRIEGYPELAYCPTHQAWKYIGNKNNRANIIKGYILHCSFYEKKLLKLIELTQKKGKNIIIEGSQITPRFFEKIKSKNKFGFLLKVKSNKEHINRFHLKNLRRSKENQTWIKNFDAIKTLDQYLTNSARNSSMTLIENIDINDTLSNIMNLVGISEVMACVHGL